MRNYTRQICWCQESKLFCQNFRLSISYSCSLKGFFFFCIHYKALTYLTASSLWYNPNILILATLCHLVKDSHSLFHGNTNLEKELQLKTLEVFVRPVSQQDLAQFHWGSRLWTIFVLAKVTAVLWFKKTFLWDRFCNLICPLLESLNDEN